VLIAAFFKLFAPVIIVLPGVIAWHMFKDSMAPSDYLLAYPSLVKAVLPPAAAGLFAAVMVGAVLSTFNSVLNSAATLFSLGVYQGAINRKAEGRQLVVAGRACSIVLAIGAMLAAPSIDTSGSLYNYLQQINATFFGPMLAVILAALFTRRISAAAAKTALIAGPVVFYLINFAFFDEIQAFLMTYLGADEPVHFLHFLAFVFVLTIVLMIVVSKLQPSVWTPMTTADTGVDLKPWRYAKEASAVVVIGTLAFYIALAQ
jgi:SSS family solute:Na+ symporter